MAVFKEKYKVDHLGVQTWEVTKVKQVNPLTNEEIEIEELQLRYSTPFEHESELGKSHGLNIEMMGLKKSQMKPNLYEKGSVLWYLLGGNDE